MSTFSNKWSRKKWPHVVNHFKREFSVTTFFICFLFFITSHSSIILLQMKKWRFQTQKKNALKKTHSSKKYMFSQRLARPFAVGSCKIFGKSFSKHCPKISLKRGVFYAILNKNVYVLINQSKTNLYDNFDQSDLKNHQLFFMSTSSKWTQLPFKNYQFLSTSIYQFFSGSENANYHQRE